MLPKLLHSLSVILVFYFPLNLLSQPRLTAEISLIVKSLSEQINRHPEIKNVAIADFTDLSYTPNLLGKQLAEEFLISFVQLPDKNFAIISRNRFTTLLAEDNLANEGYISPEDIPKNGTLKGIDLVIEATLSPTSNNVRINAMGLELETGNVLAAKIGIVTLTPSLQKLATQTPTQSKEIVRGKIVSNEGTTKQETKSANLPVDIISRGNLKIQNNGCSYSGTDIVCSFSFSSENSDEIVSLYCSSSQVYYSSDKNRSYNPLEFRFGDRKGNRRLTQTILANESKELLVYLRADLNPTAQLPELSIKCHTNNDGIFDITFNKLPISQ